MSARIDPAIIACYGFGLGESVSSALAYSYAGGGRVTPPRHHAAAYDAQSRRRGDRVVRFYDKTYWINLLASLSFLASTIGRWVSRRKAGRPPVAAPAGPAIARE
jgi:hypothetical protein